MNHVARTTLGIMICLQVGTSLAHAQASRTWVSGVGDDVNPCSRTAPCKTFAGALAVTAPAGEISVLDSGGYGPVTIAQSVTINGEGNLVSILANGVNAITINGAGAVVTLRSLSLAGQNGAGLKGVELVNGAGAILDRVTINGFETGVSTSMGNVLIVNSTISRNSGFGVRAMAGTITVENSALAHNGVGAQAETGATVTLSNVGVYGNQTGFGCGGGTLASPVNNRKASNSGGTVPSCSPNSTIVLK